MKYETVEYFDSRFYKIPVSAKQATALKKSHNATIYKEGKERFVYIPSTTTVLGIVNQRWLNHWRGDLGNEKADFVSAKAAESGSRIHEGDYKLQLGKTLSASDFTQDEWIQVLRFAKCFNEIRPTPFFEPETTVYSIKHFSAGTLDLPWFIKGGTYNIGLAKQITIKEGNYIGDIKTGKATGSIHRYQLSDYVNSTEELHGIKVEGAFVLHTQAQTAQGWKMNFSTREEMREDFKEGFLPSRKLWSAENKNLTPRVFKMPTTIKLNMGGQDGLEKDRD